MSPRHDAWAKCINTALSNMKENSDLLVSAILTMSAIDVHKVKICYKIRFNEPMEQ